MLVNKKVAGPGIAACCICIAISFAALFPRVIYAQSYPFRFKYLTVDEGLSHTDANDIIQDKKGFIWVATYFGLNRFDGYSVKKYYNNNEPENNAFKNRLRCLNADADGNIWLGTEGGIQRFEPRTQQYTDFKITGGHTISAEKIYRSPAGKLYIIAQRRLMCYNLLSSRLTQVHLKASSDLIVYDFAPTENGTLYLATDKGLYIVEADDHLHKITIDYEQPVLPVTRINLQHNGQLTVACKNIVYQLSGTSGQGGSGRDNRLKVVYTFTTPEHAEIKDMLQDKHGDYWINMSTSILRLDGTFKPIQSIQSGQGLYSLNSASLAKILIDRSQCLWVSTFSGGLNYCDLNQKLFFTLQHNPENQNSLSGNYVRAVITDKQVVWIGTMGHGLDRYDRNTQRFMHFNTGTKSLKLKDNNVTSFGFDDRRLLWIGTYKGLQIIDPVSLKLVHVQGEADFPHYVIETLAKDCFGNMWFGNHTNRFGVIWRDDNQVYRVRYYDEGYFILPDDRKPQVFVSSTHGLDRILIDKSGNITQRFSYRATGKPNSLSSNYTYPVCKQNDSIYWVGTMGGGLNRLTIRRDNSYQINSLTEKYDIFKDVEAMELAKDGNVWMGGNGLECLNLQQQNELIKYDKNDGLQGNSFKVGSSYAGEDGVLYFGGINGLNFFNPANIAFNKIPAQPIITDILINNRTPAYNQDENNKSHIPEAVSYTDHLRLNYLQNNFVIFFSAMHFSNPLKCRYRYKLAGFDKGWNYTDGRKPSAFYSNLDYSNYKFIVEATNNDGIWSSSQALITITVTPPWWKSTAAKAVYFALALALLVGIYIYQARWYRLKRDLAIRKINEAKREEMHQHREELYKQQLMFFTNISHEFRTPLTLIIGPLEVLLKENEDSMLHSSYQLMLRNAKRLINLISELMNFKKIADSVIKLQVQRLDVNSFCQDIAGDFTEIAQSKRIEFEFLDHTHDYGGEHRKGMFDVQILEKIIFNLLNNAFKYTNIRGKVIFELFFDFSRFNPLYPNSYNLLNEDYRADEYIYFRIADTGIGISEESINKIFDRYYRISNNHLGSGVGLSLVKSLTHLHKGDIFVYSDRDKGTEIVIAIPWGEQHYSNTEKATAGAGHQVRLEPIDNSVLLSPDAGTLQPVRVSHSGRNILIVDDNQELRLFLKQVLEKEYGIYEAEHGEAALELAFEKMPDLVISDIMMPLMDGIEFCKQMKERFETRHIPIVLLSARDSLDTKIAGLESGADFYFAKPLNIELLLLTVNNIFQQRDVLKERYTNNYLAEATELVHSEKDKEFFNKLLSLIEDNMEDADLDVDFLCKHLFVSRTKLYQKIKSISDQSVAEFIRTVRLKRSIYIMTHEDVTMNEVADRVGLQSSSNFSRAFKKEYGKSPMQFMQSLKKMQV